MRISDWSSDVCSSDLTKGLSGHSLGAASVHEAIYCLLMLGGGFMAGSANIAELDPRAEGFPVLRETRDAQLRTVMSRSEEHTSELQSLMRLSYAVFCLTKKNTNYNI